MSSIKITANIPNTKLRIEQTCVSQDPYKWKLRVYEESQKSKSLYAKEHLNTNQALKIIKLLLDKPIYKIFPKKKLILNYLIQNVTTRKS